MSWEKLIKADMTVQPLAVTLLLKKNPDVAKTVEGCEYWISSKYQVALRRMGADGAGGEIVHLSIKRKDRAAIPNWRDFQMIKNQLCGLEAEGVELYPAESRVVDLANQFHLWVFTKLPIKLGFPSGMKEEAAKYGAVQEPGATKKILIVEDGA